MAATTTRQSILREISQTARAIQKLFPAKSPVNDAASIPPLNISCPQHILDQLDKEGAPQETRDFVKSTLTSLAKTYEDRFNAASREPASQTPAGRLAMEQLRFSLQKIYENNVIPMIADHLAKAREVEERSRETSLTYNSSIPPPVTPSLPIDRDVHLPVESHRESFNGSSSAKRKRPPAQASEESSFNKESIPFLTRYFAFNSFPSPQDRILIARKSKMSQRQIEIWFQNRRRRYLAKNLELAYRRPTDAAPLDLCLDEWLTPDLKGFSHDSAEIDPEEAPDDTKHISILRPRYTKESSWDGAEEAVFPCPHFASKRKKRYTPTKLSKLKLKKLHLGLIEWFRKPATIPPPPKKRRRAPVAPDADLRELGTLFSMMHVELGKKGPRGQGDAAIFAITVKPEGAPLRALVRSDALVKSVGVNLRQTRSMSTSSVLSTSSESSTASRKRKEVDLDSDEESDCGSNSSKRRKYGELPLGRVPTTSLRKTPSSISSRRSSSSLSSRSSSRTPSYSRPSDEDDMDSLFGGSDISSLSSSREGSLFDTYRSLR